ncbi:DUF2306 domain-containing protein [Candidatus Villigracilis affinis]|uniref:DUF2306 domain-containing protein n=1 Tax=Candidatus Villigracilis affinis TaxID=3140682 RepID=UPI001D4703A4|nr:DUF2306 domain-containing protein [Anaerolineales bacterium]
MIYQFVSTFHMVSAVSALIFGACVLLARKGTRLHKQLGYAYFFNMLGLNLTALFIYQLTGHFGPFHGAALASLLTLLAGFIPAYLRLPHGRWLEFHYEFMNWSYVGLIAAGVSEVATRLPSAPFWPAVVASMFVVFLLGGISISRGRGKYMFNIRTSVVQSDSPANWLVAFKRRRTVCQ